MEKTTDTAKRKQRAGLLIFFLFLMSQGFARSLSRSEIQKLVVKADSQSFFTARDNGYTLTIPGIESTSVQTDLSPLPLGVKFISSKKEEFFDSENERGTKIHIWFTFSDPGLPKLPPLITLINGRTYYIPFETVQVYENPDLISPVLSIEFDDNSKLTTDQKTKAKIYHARAGEEIRYKIYIQYYQQILNYSWELPKDSIFTELMRYESSFTVSNEELHSKKKFTPELFPVSYFSWKPLKSGNYELPPVFAEAISYNGSRKQLYLPSYTISVSNAPLPKGKQTEQNDDIYNSAFTEKKIDPISAIRYVPDDEDCKKLAELRSQERRDGFLKKIRQERISFEKSIGIISNEDEPSNIFSRFFSGRYGIFAGGQVSPVPEEKTLSHNASPAQRVKILEQAGEWSYIENKDFSGWVKTDRIYEIK